MSQERFRPYAAVYVLLKKECEVLMLRRANTGYRDGFYTLPSGHFDGGEPARAVASREAEEEVGVIIDPKDLEFFHVTHRKSYQEDREYIDFYFQTEKWSEEPKNNEPEKCDDVGWFEIEKLPENTIPDVKEAIESLQKNKFFSEFGWDWKE